MSDQPEFRYVGFWVRLIATLLDWILLTLASTGVQYLIIGIANGVLWLMTRGSDGGTASVDLNMLELQILNTVLYGAMALPYYSLGHIRYRTTLGKVLFKVEVVDSTTGGTLTLKQSVIRTFGYLISYLPMGAGFLMVAFNPRKQGLHELMASSVSVYRVDRPAEG